MLGHTNDKREVTRETFSIPAPADGCPECLRRYNPPVTSVYSHDRDGVTGFYLCAGCGHRWTCNWMVSAL